MDRRAALTTLFKPQEEVKQFSPPTGSFQPYQGPWTRQEAAHLLRRTTFGFSTTALELMATTDVESAVAQLTEPLPLPSPPVNYDFEGDPDVPIGQTWVNAPHSAAVNTNNYRRRSLYAWSIGRVVSREVHIREKVTLFWHNHFPIADIADGRFEFKYIDTIRRNALGSFKTLAEEITIDPAMLRYLNGNQNIKTSPNENYARELLELFTIGKGPLAGPGDYTNYTEQDVREIAKALTGWRDTGYRNTNLPTIGAAFTAGRHDTTTKTLSHRFGNASISDQGQNEYKAVLNIIFQKEEVSKFIARKLYRWFVYYKIDTTVEADIITPMAQMIRDNNYEILPALRALLKSEHFYEPCNRGVMIKSPVDFGASLIGGMGVPISSVLKDQYSYWLRIYNSVSPLQMVMFSLPSVAGWKAYYQEPSYYQIWLNSVTLPLRVSMSDTVMSKGLQQANQADNISFLDFIKDLPNALDVNELINHIITFCLPNPITNDQFNELKEILLPGLPDYEWPLEYGAYLANPQDAQIKRVLESKLSNLFIQIARMPEYQLS